MKAQGGCKSFLSLFSLVLAAVSVSASLKSNVDSMDEDNQCELYCFRALKPLIVAVEKNVKKNQRCEENETQIQRLQEELNEMQMNASIHKNFEDMHSKCKDELNSALSEKSCSEKNESLIEFLRAQIDEKTEAISLLITQVNNLNSSGPLHNQQTGEPMQKKDNNSVPLKSFCNGFTGVQTIEIGDMGPVSVLCDFQTAGPIWAVVQRRFDGSVDFFRNWTEYRSGFGNLSGEFFMGLEHIHRMTTSVRCELYIKLVDFDDTVRHALYDHFLIGSEEEEYKLKSLGTYSGTAGDALRYNLHDSFTTYNRDFDGWANGNCARYYHSGWWYNLYGNSNLNGKYFDSEISDVKSIWWFNWKGYNALKAVQMMIRPAYSAAEVEIQ